MHSSLLPLVFGEHAGLIARAGILPSSFVELDPPQRHALVCALVIQQGRKTNISSLEQIRSFIGDVDELILTMTEKINSASLWPAKAYRALGKLIRCPQALKLLRHTDEVTESSVYVLRVLPADWRRLKIVQMISTPDQARALASLGETINTLAGDSREQEFRELVERITDVRQLRKKFQVFVLRSLDATRLPRSRTPFLERVASFSDCRRLAQMGHCFGDIDMIECVLGAWSYYYEWSRHPGVVVEIKRDDFPFSWTVVQALKPKGRSLDKSEFEMLLADLQDLGVPLTKHRLSTRVETALEHFD